jgi:hypothetical protein
MTLRSSFSRIASIGKGLHMPSSATWLGVLAFIGLQAACVSSSTPAKPTHDQAPAQSAAPLHGSQPSNRPGKSIADAGTESGAHGSDAADAEVRDDRVARDQTASIGWTDPNAWLDASGSRSRQIAMSPGVCLRDVGGCPFSPTRLPTCPSDQDYVEIESRNQLESLVGVTTVFKGKLRKVKTISHMTAASCGGEVSLVGPPFVYLTRATLSNVDLLDTTLRLGDSRFPHAFECPGDDAVQCCGIQTEVPALVHGKLVRSTGGPTPLEIERPSLCASP